MVGEAHPPADWPKTYQEAVALQEELRGRVELVPLARPVAAGGRGGCHLRPGG